MQHYTSQVCVCVHIWAGGYYAWIPPSPRPTSAWHPCKGSWKWQWCQESYYRYSTRMTGFSALAIKSTLIPPITTFKREENGKKSLEDLRRHFPSLLCFSKSLFPYSWKLSNLQFEGLCLFWMAIHRSVQS